MGVRDLPIHAHAELVAEQRSRSDAAEMSKVRPKQSGGDNASLLVTLPVSKEEKAVAANRASERETELPPLEEGIRIGRVALESRIGSQVVVAEEIKSGAMQNVTA